MRGVSVNIYDFLDAKKNGKMPRRFPSKHALVKYMQQHPEKMYPLSMAKANEFLRVLLVGCFQGQYIACGIALPFNH